MRLARVDSALPQIEDVLTDAGNENLVYLSAMVPPAHKDLIVELARLNRTKQAAVLRVIIDEWCERARSDIEKSRGKA